MSDTSLHNATGDFTGPGVTAAQTPEQLRAQQAAFNQAQINPNSAPPSGWQQQVPMTTTVTASGMFTAADVERIRQEEKSKLYPQLAAVDEIRAELNTLKAEREAAEQAKAAAEAAAAEAARKAEEDQMDVRQLLQRQTEEWNTRFAQVEQERLRAEALLEKERQFAALNEYKAAQLAVHGDSIIPPLRKYVTGETQAEIDASIEAAQANSVEIIQGVAQAQQQQWSGMRGTAPTAPVGGPLENAPIDRALTDVDIRNMSMAEYARNRGTLHQAASRQFNGR